MSSTKTTFPTPSEWIELLPWLTRPELAELDSLLRTSPSTDPWLRLARPNQLAPAGDWQTWLFLAGRGTGKTRAGAEWVRMMVETGKAKRVALVAPTAADARDVMVEGQSGILSCCPPHAYPKYEPSKRRVTWPNGAIATTYSADEPDRLRGPQHDLAWADELAAWQYPDTWDMLQFGLRLGADPRCCVTTTPRPVRMVRELMDAKTTVITRGTTYENRENLAPSFFDRIVARYEGTRLGRQELNAEVLDDNPFALWQRDRIDELRVVQAPELARVVVAVDPQAGDTENAAETGIIVAGIGTDGHGYVIADKTIRASPDTWAKEVIAAYHLFRADRVVAEINQGGAMVEHTLRTVFPNVPYIGVHASRGKQIRAEPIAALYEQGRVHHVGQFPDLEDQLVNWVPGAEESPDRLDSLVWALTELDIAVSVWEFYSS
jgi:phage terminase large subunit-like protein